MEKITILEKELQEEIKKLIVGENIDNEEILSKLKEFFHSKKQEDIDKLNPRNIRLFTVALEILQENKKLFPVNLANLDYVYSYKNEPLKYLWKSCEFNLSKDFIKIKDVLIKVAKGLNLSEIKIKKIQSFMEQADKMCKEKYSSDMESIGLFNETKDSFIYLEYHIFDDDYRNERVCKFNILLVSPKTTSLKMLPNNKGTIYSNLVFRES